MKPTHPIHSVQAEAYTFGTLAPEADGTLDWNSTTVLVVHVQAGGHTGLGYAYTSAGAAAVVRDIIAPRIEAKDALDTAEMVALARKSVRNVGRSGIAASAVAAVDIALWDLKARLLDSSLIDLLGAARQAIPVYGSGGFTNQSQAETERMFGAWLDQGVRMMKMKVGADIGQDAERVKAVRHFLGPHVELFVDANGAYTRKQAVAMAHVFGDHNVTWFEEPVSSDDRVGLHFVRQHVPPQINVAAGEYGYNLDDFRLLLEDEAVDVLQADATRCQGVTGFMEAAALARAFHVPLSAHTQRPHCTRRYAVLPNP